MAATATSPANKSVFAKVKHAGVKAKAFDADGNEVEFDVRDDEEQSVKLDETVELLLAAGYFRARIRTLSPFDKVVGGMTWCITASNVEVDVDLLFQENSTIKQKISLTEKIVAALKRMKCPHRLEPYQIQGLDFIHIYPVVQWLVKKAIETREETNQQIRNRAILEFSKQSTTPEDTALIKTVDNARVSIGSVRDSYRPKRMFKAPQDSRADRETRVHATLLEYGRRYGISRKQPKTDNENKRASVLAKGDDEPDLAQQEEQRISQLMKGMAEAGEFAISSSAVGSIVGLQSAAIAQLSEEYAAQQASRSSADNDKLGGIAAHKRAVLGLTKRIDQTEKKIEATQAEHETVSAAYKAAQTQYSAASKEARRILQETESLDALEGDESNKPILAKLRSLVSLNDLLKKQEQMFKASCKEEMSSLQEKIGRFKGQGVEVVDIDDERAKAISKQFEEETKRLQKSRIQAAKRNYEISALQRKIDEVPSRAELTQYQRRFVELYEQMAAKLRETKQYFTLFNTLVDTKLYMEKELSLLVSIYENFTRAMASAANKEQFLNQCQQIVTGVKGNLTKVEEKQTREKTQRDKLSDEHLQLVEKGRLYFKTVKDYEAECGKNELLLAKLKKRSE